MELSELQANVDRWIRDTTGGYWDRFQILARLTEELGEVAAALQRQEGLRPRESDAELAQEVGDVLFTLAAFANVNDIRLDEAVSAVFEKYTARDAEAWRDASSTRE